MKKKIITLFMAAVMCLSLAACGSEKAASSAPSKPAAVATVQPGKLVMSTNATFAPYESVADDGQGYKGTGYEGIDVEIAYAVAQKLGLKLEIDDMDFTAAVNAPAQGKADFCMAGLTVTNERKKNLDFSTPYANGVQVVIVPKNSDIEKVADLSKDKMIGTQEGTTGYIYCSASVKEGGYGENHVIAYDSGSTAVQALLKKKVDAVVIDQAPAKEYVKANPSLTILPAAFTDENYAIAVKKGNSALLKKINAALKSLTADGTLKSIMGKYISAN